MTATTHRRMLRLVAVLGALALLLQGCWGGDDADDATTTTSLAAPIQTTTTSEASSPGEASPETTAAPGTPPPGVSDQFTLAGFPSFSLPCAVALNGPGTLVQTIEVDPIVIGQLYLGSLELETILGEEIRSAIDDVIPTITFVRDFTPLSLPPGETLTTVTLPELEIVPPSIVPASPAEVGEVELLAKALLCGSGWTPSAFVQVTVTTQDGEPVAETFAQVGETGSLGSIWEPLPVSDPGRYVTAASDGTNQATGEVDLVSATERRIRVLGKSVGDPGDSFQIGIAGFAANDVVRVHLYRFDSNNGGRDLWRYVRTPVGIATNAAGAAAFNLSTPNTDEEGRYCLIGDGMSYGLPIQCSDAGYALGEPFQLIPSS